MSDYQSVNRRESNAEKAKAPVITPGLLRQSRCGQDLPSNQILTLCWPIVNATLVGGPQRAAELNRSG